MTNRKSHTCYRLVPKSVTLDNLKGPLRTLFQNTCFQSSVQKFESRWTLTISDKDVAQWLDSGSIRFMWIFAGVFRFPGEGGIKQHWGNRKCGFSGFRTLRLWHLRKWGQHYYKVLFNPLSPFHWPKIRDLEWLWMACPTLCQSSKGWW